jgi:hypothetical protein
LPLIKSVTISAPTTYEIGNVTIPKNGTDNNTVENAPRKNNLDLFFQRIVFGAGLDKPKVLGLFYVNNAL